MQQNALSLKILPDYLIKLYFLVLQVELIGYYNNKLLDHPFLIYERDKRKMREVQGHQKVFCVQTRGNTC